MGELLNAFERTADAASTLPVDDALVEAGRTIARRVDEAVATAEGQEVTKALYLVPHLNNILREMLATPLSRKANGIEDGGESSGGSKLGKLRSVNGGKS